MNDTFRFCQAGQADEAAVEPISETSSSRPDSATLEEGTQGTVTLDELFFLLSRGAIGTPPKKSQKRPDSAADSAADSANARE